MLADDQTIFIAPKTAQAPRIAAMIRSQGDGRGFHMPDGTLVVFDSYGNTHDSVTRFFSNGGRRVDMGVGLIFRLNGEIPYDASFGRLTLDQVFADAAPVIRRIVNWIDPTVEPRLVN